MQPAATWVVGFYCMNIGSGIVFKGSDELWKFLPQQLQTSTTKIRFGDFSKDIEKLQGNLALESSEQEKKYICQAFSSKKKREYKSKPFPSMNKNIQEVSTNILFQEQGTF